MPDDTNTIEVPTDIAPDAIASDYLLTIARFDGGDLARLGSEHLAKVIDHVLKTGKKSKLSLDLVVVPHERAESGTPQVVFVPQFKLTLPPGSPSQSRMYVYAAAHATQVLPYDPQQRDLFLARKARIETPNVVKPKIEAQPVRDPVRDPAAS